MEGADIAALGVLFFKDSCRGGGEARKKLALVIKTLLDGRYLAFPTSAFGLCSCGFLVYPL